MRKSEPLFRVRGVVDNGKLRILSRKAFEQWIGSIQGPKQIIVEFREVESSRSKKQNNLWEALVRRYAIQYGETFEDARTLFKLRHGVAIPINHDFSPATAKDRPGIFVLHGGEYYYLVSTADYSPEEMNFLIEGTIRDCIEAGVPTEDYLI